MTSTPTQPDSGSPSLARNLRALGKIVKTQRVSCELDLLDAADYMNVAVTDLSHLEDGRSVETGDLFNILNELGLVMLVMTKDDATDALSALGQNIDWHQGTTSSPIHRKFTAPVSAVPVNTTPTLFVDFDGTLHVGNSLIDEHGQITLDTGGALLEFAPLLVNLLEPYPSVEIVLTTSWTQTLPLEKIISYLPSELARRVVATTRGTKARLGYIRDGTDRTYIICKLAGNRRLTKWLALDDRAYGIEKFERVPGELQNHFVCLTPSRGINDRDALNRIQEWLVSVHAAPSV
ncbi:HAD domain-containing protein [Paraburkholderia hospita]|uniref:HAD domain-containing protein n=1 Tax=Paraburkholderia hospita TaxID=169430 RepID=UPI0009CBDF14|nr:HAD domain-containing protein [Paraburkholderia hospita]SKC93235.1 hypothetical protein SAMN05446934_6472 [Paraburkholderia hospita]